MVEGFRTRISEETPLKLKPIVEISGKPIIWNILKMCSSYKINDFIILIGYKTYYIKVYFSTYFLHQSDVTIDLKDDSVAVHYNSTEPWKVTFFNTGANTLTVGRIKGQSMSK